MRALVIFVETLHDLPSFELYRARVMPTLTAFQGKFVVRGGAFSVIEGDWPFERTAVLEFPSRALAEAWYASPSYQEILPLRLNSARCNAIIVDAVD